MGKSSELEEALGFAPRTRTQEEWEAAREELAKLEAEQAERTRRSRRSGWSFRGSRWRRSTSSIPGTARRLADLFEGRSQLLAYNVMFGPDYSMGACPGCTNLADGLSGSRST